MAAACVVHLVWGPLGPEPVARFAASLQAHPAGIEHELLVLRNGVEGDPAPVREALGGLAHREHRLPAPVQDLPAYRAALERCAPGPVVFLNSYARVLADGWLATLLAPLAAGAGLVGASGSWESAFTSAPRDLVLQRARQFPAFPNPALRTNAWGGDRDLLLSLDWGMAPTKLGALQLESGRQSLTRQVRARGLPVVVVGRDGRAHPPAGWAASRTFRAGGQEQLLVADNRTDDYAAADAAERARLARMAWGRRPDLAAALLRRRPVRAR